jgi:hypothetical protein
MANNQEQMPIKVNSESISAGKRTLLKAAWVVPVVVAINLPKSSFAANVSGGHQGGGHQGGGPGGICDIKNQGPLVQILQKFFRC